jgi:hypothetical protein
MTHVLNQNYINVIWRGIDGSCFAKRALEFKVGHHYIAWNVGEDENMELYYFYH